MTIRGYGRVTPVQLEMLYLPGGVFKNRQVTKVAKDSERIQSMRQARAKLIRITGKDFGYDLGRWHSYLSSLPEDEDCGYRHCYAWSNVKRAIIRSLEDDSRIRLINLILQDNPPVAGEEWEQPIELPPTVSQKERIQQDAPPSPRCGKKLRTEKAKQCFHCGEDWH